MAVSTRSLVLTDVSWGEFQRIASTFARRRMRFTYDRGRLEIVSPSSGHEGGARYLEVLFLEWHRVRGVSVVPVGATRYKSRRLRRATEPDNSYYIAHAAAVRGPHRIDLDTHPPPDVVVEVDVTRQSVRKLPIYRAFGVPEVWRVVRGRIVCRVLRNGRYVVTDTSEQVPGLRPADLEPFLTALVTEPMVDVQARFTAWCQAQP